MSRTNSASEARCHFSASGPLLAECHFIAFPSEFIVILVNVEWMRGSRYNDFVRSSHAVQFPCKLVVIGEEFLYTINKTVIFT
jgi:hypothetical protein